MSAEPRTSAERRASAGPFRIVVLGLSLSSSWGNGHATTYRSILKALAARGHDILFLERDVPWYASERDLTEPGYCGLAFYRDLDGLAAHDAAIAAADAVIIGSYVPDGIAVGARVQRVARGAKAFYDIDTPVTLAALDRGECSYLSAALIPGYDLYLSFTGGPTLRRLEGRYGAPMARALYCCVDPALYRPRDDPTRWDLTYLGTYSPDRQPVLDRLLLEPARRAPHLRFAVAGPQYPADIDWPANVERFEHVSPPDHPEFYGSGRFTLNVTRADMVRAGWSPSVRLFEAAACATPVISDRWAGLEALFEPDRDILLAESAEAALAILTTLPDERRRAIARQARQAVLGAHTAAHRAAELESFLVEARVRAGAVPA